MIKKLPKISAYFLAFIIPGLIFLYLLKVSDIVPFGNYTLACYDLRGQYISFLSYLRSILLTNNDLVYTFTKPLGGDMISLLTYYIFSPFNILYLFVDATKLPLMISIVTTLKIATCGLTMYIFLNYLYKGEILKNLTLAMSYALCSYMIIFHFNILWIDGVIMLPLIILGLMKIFDGKKPYLYAIFLAISILSNYYTGFMTCIFVVMFFLYYTHGKKREKSEIKVLYQKFIIGSLLAGVMSSFSWVNAVLAFSGTKTSLNRGDISNFSPITSMWALMNAFNGGSYVGTSDIINGAPLIFVGCFALYLAVLYFANKSVDWKEKVGAGAIIAIFTVSFFIRAIDNLWHGGAPPTWFTYRYAFLFVFFIIYLASRVFNTHLKDIRPRDYLLVLVFALLQLTYSLYKNYSNMLYIELAMGLIMLGCVFALVKLKSPIIRVSCITLIFTINLLDLSKSTEHDLKINIAQNEYMLDDVYQSDLEYITPIIDYIKEYAGEEEFYRMEKTFYRSSTYNMANNDSALFDYAGISHYSSSDKLNVRNYLGERLGFNNSGFWNAYGLGSTIGINSLMNVKYIVDGDYFYNSALIPSRLFGGRNYLTHLEDFPTSTSSVAHVFENPYALGMGFMRKNTSFTYGSQGEYVGDPKDDGTRDVYWYNTYEYINRIFKDLTGIEEDIYKPLEVTITTNNVEQIDDNHFELVNSTSKGNIRFTINLDDPNLINGSLKYPCYYSIYPKISPNHISLYDPNGRNLYYFGYYNHGINPIMYDSRTSVTYNLELNEDLIWKGVFFKPDFFYEDTNVLQRHTDELKKNSLSLKKITSSHLKGQVTYSQDKPLLMLSIPYEGHWKVKVNGKATSTRLVQDIFLGVSLDNGLYSDGQILNIDVQYNAVMYDITEAIGVIALAYILLVGYLRIDKKIYKYISKGKKQNDRN